MSNAAQFIGIDLGRSAAKAVARQGANEYRVMFPNAVAKAGQLVFGELAASAEPDTVTINGEDYWTGMTAISQNTRMDPIGRNDDWVLQIAHDALVMSAIKRLQQQGMQYDAGNVVVTIGVPSRVYKYRLDVIPALRTRTAKLLGVDVSRVHVQAQPMGVIAAYCLDTDGANQDQHDISSESYAVIEVGQFTTDFAAILQGKPNIDATESTDGVELITESVRNHLRAADESIILPSLDLASLSKSRSIRARGKDHDVGGAIDKAVANLLAPKVIESAKKAFSPMLLQQCDAILIAGGGAPVLFEAIKTDRMFNHAVQVQEPREAVADGFARLSAMFYNLAK